MKKMNLRQSAVRLTVGLLCLGAGAALQPALQAQALGEAELQTLRQSFDKDASTRAIQNVLTQDANIKANALNRERQGKIDHFFKYRVDVKGITDQKRSGRCWMFTSLNTLRPLVMKKYNLDAFDFSHNYLYFYDMLEKSNLFLENMIRTADRDQDDREVVTFFQNPVNDGGVWNLYYNVASKYGLVPAEVMPETEHANATSQMVSLLNERLRKGGMEIRKAAAQAAADQLDAAPTETVLRNIKMATLKDVYRILSLCLGEPPVTFTWRYKTKDGDIKALTDYTPMRFYEEVVPADFTPDQYVMIMHDPTRPYYQMYDIANYRNTYEGLNWVYLNLPLEDIKKAALASIKANEPLYTSSDVTKQFQSDAGLLDTMLYDYNSLFGVDFTMEKKDRILSRQSGSAHAMLLIGCDTDGKDNPVKWEFENSWGANAGHNGYLTFTDGWFNEYMFRFVINKKYLDSKALKALKTTPEALPVWDYMF